jgi:hypothetical protein
MKVEIEVCGYKVCASTDYVPHGRSEDEINALEGAAFARLCSEARIAAKEYISRINVNRK